jgi:hypothetical protein
VPVEALQSKWVPDAHTSYIGKADNARRRLEQFARFGAGEPVAHWGGRYIWQLADSAELLVAWHAITWDELARETRSDCWAEVLLHLLELLQQLQQKLSLDCVLGAEVEDPALRLLPDPMDATHPAGDVLREPVALRGVELLALLVGTPTGGRRALMGLVDHRQVQSARSRSFITSTCLAKSI